MFKDKRTGIWHSKIAGRQYSLKTRNSKLAREREIKIKNDFLDGTFGIRRKSRIQFYQLGELYLKKLQPHVPNFNRKKKDIESRLKKHIYPHFANRAVVDIKSRDIKEWADHLSIRLKPDGINRIINVFRSIIKWGVKNDLGIPFDPISHWPHYKVTNEEWTMLTRDEVENVLECTQTDFLVIKSMVVTALFTGMRLSNIVNLKWSEVDLDNGFIKIGALETKQRATLIVPILPDVKNILEAQKEKNATYVFVKDNGKVWHPNSVSRAWRINKIYAGIDRRVRFHDLRHTFASHLTMQGKSAEIVAEVLGHRSISTTKRYQHLSPEFLKKTLDGFSFNGCQPNVNRTYPKVQNFEKNERNI